MSLLEFSGLEFGYTHERVIAEATGALQPGEVVGLVGANGGGKTTLIRLLLLVEAPEAGSVQISKEAKPWAYVSQSDQGEDHFELFSFVRGGRRDLAEIESRLVKFRERADSEETLIELGELEARYETLGGHQLDNDVERLLTGLSFAADQFHQQLGTMSGGQRQKACIARALNRNANLIIFDEPTNHLDLAAQEFFVNRVRGLGTEKGVLLVSHDRWLLDAVCTQVWELDGGVLYRYKGNHSRSMEQRRLRRERMRLDFEKQQEHIAKTEDFIRRNIAGQNTRQAQGRRKLLNRMERLEAPEDDAQISFALTPALTPGHQLLIVENLAFAYDEKPAGEPAAVEPQTPNRSFDKPGAGAISLNPPMDAVPGVSLRQTIISDVEFTVYRGERLGIVGPNGCGKSTLLRLLARHLVPGKGLIAWGTNVELGIFHQDSADLSEGYNLLQELRKVEPGITDSAGRDYLGRFGFSGDDVFDDTLTLSGGEKSRMSLAKIFRRRPNVLLFDEPTNHLDIYAREALEQLLLSYEGSLIMVTHDRALLERVCDRLVIFEENPAGGWVQHYFRGSYRDYLKWRGQQGPEPVGGADESVDGQFHGVSEERIETYTPAYLEMLARDSRTSVSGYCEKQLARLADKSDQVEVEIDGLEQRKLALESEQRQADRQQEYGRLESLQHQIDAVRELIEEHFATLAQLETDRLVWETHLGEARLNQDQPTL